MNDRRCADQTRSAVAIAPFEVIAPGSEAWHQVEEAVMSMLKLKSVEQVEYPNLLMPNGVKRNLNDIKEASLRGKKVLTNQVYDIQKYYVIENTVILETIWIAELAVPVGHIPAGVQMKAYFAQFIEFENGKIVRQRTYDCFEPF